MTQQTVALRCAQCGAMMSQYCAICHNPYCSACDTWHCSANCRFEGTWKPIDQQSLFLPVHHALPCEVIGCDVPVVWCYRLADVYVCEGHRLEIAAGASVTFDLVQCGVCLDVYPRAMVREGVCVDCAVQ